MNAPTFASVLADIRRVDNDEKNANEAIFQEWLKDYMLHRRPFMYGGISNCLTTMQGICEELAHDESLDLDTRDAYMEAAEKLGECSNACDIKYREEA